jgi:hypothetical protein
MTHKFYYRKLLKFIYYRAISCFYYLLELKMPSRIKDYKRTPIIINNFNRLDSLRQLIWSLEKRGYTNLYIIDNHSSYLPLLDYYRKCPYTVFHLDENIGMNALWKTGIYNRFKRDFFVYTDSDVVPIEECPENFLLLFHETLKKHKLARKVGFSLKIDDIPDCYSFREEVIDNEKHFFKHKQDEFLFWAPIDTTFALYRPYGKRKHAYFNIEMYRCAFPYMARHIPWYIDSNNPDEENRYYIENAKTLTSWTQKNKRIMKEKKVPVEHESVA